MTNDVSLSNIHQQCMVDQVHRKLEKHIADGLIHFHDAKPNPGAGIKETVEEVLKRASLRLLARNP